MEERCVFKSRSGVCVPLKQTKCEGCRFYMTKDTLELKNKEVVRWYDKRGIDYDEVVSSIIKGEKIK